MVQRVKEHVIFFWREALGNGAEQRRTVFQGN